MAYYTTVKTVNSNGQAIKAEVTCGGKPRGFTDPNTGELSFELRDNSSYSVSAKRSGGSASGSVYGGKQITLRLS
ncbi:hypothetical protein [Amphritea balenae]|uniref:Uncharacterized protein n=1 Tax=Amphritea balenae TaxID=452629 RepID=A0A3P1SMA3_9GAMM|nr:hypothetical protein [Amphritea balenae]RRC98278.1 hypothetical protein EHS89_14395 [Amphritea balenae]GGK80621.1 hypothetical protein GCM10007941_33740 [Amphritea balenae]